MHASNASADERARYVEGGYLWILGAAFVYLRTMETNPAAREDEPTVPELILCIICMTMKPRRTGVGEHVIPKALGGSFTIRRVCVDCDSHLGTVADAGLINVFSIEQRRAELRLAGNNRTVPDPGARLRKVPFVSESDAKHRAFEVLDPETGKTSIRTQSRVEFEVTPMDGGMLIEPVSVHIDPADQDKAEMFAVSALKKAGIRDEALVKKHAAEFAANLETIEVFEMFSKRVEIKTGGYENGFLKIAYEMAWHWLGESWLYSPEAIAMRELLAGEKPSTRIRGKVYDEPNAGVVAVEGDPRVVHSVFVYENAGELVLEMRIFELFTAGLVVAKSAHDYHVPHLNAIAMHSVKREFEETHFGQLEMAPEF
jgi:HNH endonuclease